MLLGVNYHVYIDRLPTGIPFYVGIGNDRRIKVNVRNKWHTSIRKKYPGWYRTVIETAPRKLCQEFEEFLISEIGRRDLGKGTLVNLTDGGEGAPNTVVSEATRQKQSLKSKGRKFTESHRKAMSTSSKGRKFTEEHKNNISMGKKGKQVLPPEVISANAKKMWEKEGYKENHSKMMKDKWEEPEYRDNLVSKHQIRMANPVVREELSVKISKAWESPKLRQEASERTKGTMWMNKDGKSKRVKQDNAELMFSEGWKKGRK